MDSTIIIVLTAIAALVAGVLLGKVVFAKNTKNVIEEAERRARKIEENAEIHANKLKEDAKISSETLKEKKLVEAKEKYLQLKSRHEQEVQQRSSKLVESEARIKQKEQALNDRMQQLQKQLNETGNQREQLEKQLEVVSIRRAELEKHQEEHVRRLEKVSNLSAEEAKNELMEAMKEEARTGALAHIKEIVEEAKINANKEAKKIVIQSIQRVASEQTIDN